MLAAATTRKDPIMYMNQTDAAQFLKYKLIETHISDIQPGDTVLHEGKVKTVTVSNIKRNSFMGTTLWGDSYHLGHKPVLKLDL